MATFVLAQIDAAIDLFTSLIQQGASTPRYKRNLQWLSKLRARAASKISTASTTQEVDSHRDTGLDPRRSREDAEDGEDIELLGWRTRLIERVGQGRQTIRTIRLATTQTSSHTKKISSQQSNENQLDGPQIRVRAGETPNASLHMVTPDSTDALVRPTAELLMVGANVP